MQQQPLVTVYSKPSCVQCEWTKRQMIAKGIDYEEFDVSKDEVALERVRALGYLQAPVVVVDRGDGSIEHWSGLDPDRIDSILIAPEPAIEAGPVLQSSAIQDETATPARAVAM